MRARIAELEAAITTHRKTMKLQGVEFGKTVRADNALWAVVDPAKETTEAVTDDEFDLLAHLRTLPSFDEWSAPDVMAYGTCPVCGRGMRQHRTWDRETEHAEWAVGCPCYGREAQ